MMEENTHLALKGTLIGIDVKTSINSNFGAVEAYIYLCSYIKVLECYSKFNP